ncbi:MAG TPA: hypothetical protein VEW48_05250 [Thermoanaerobaculia bacterium]|nr:hypothetical protein [Thermoanaerobaculia bacterium]
MKDWTLAEHLDFLVAERGEDEATVLAEALRTGVEALYREALVEGFLLGRIPREKVLLEVGLEALTEIELQREALQRDVAWGLRGA